MKHLAGATGLRVPRPVVVLLIGAFVAATPGGSQSTAAFEPQPVERKAEDVLPSDLLQGDRHVVDPVVQSDGYMNRYLLKTDFGDFDVEGDRLLRIRIAELEAIARLRELGATESFAKAIASSAKDVGRQTVAVVTRPGETLENIPRGVALKAKGMWFGAKKTARKAAALAQDLNESGLSGVRKKASGEETKDSSGRCGDPPQLRDRALSLLGYEGSVRRLANRLRIDPYSTNCVLRDELERLGKAAFVADLTFDFLDPVPSELQQVGGFYDLAWRLPKRELERRNDRALKTMSLPAALRFSFFENRWFTPTEQTELVFLLEQLDGVAGRDEIVTAASTADSRSAARYFLGVASLLTRYADERGLSQIRRLERGEGFALVGLSRPTGGVVALPFDYLSWRVAGDGSAPFFDLGVRDLWVSGEVASETREELEERGWQLRTGVPLER
ncbi:MAG: hypothetical protein AAGA81_19620 [Acidobacteriota bacterium]